MITKHNPPPPTISYSKEPQLFVGILADAGTLTTTTFLATDLMSLPHPFLSHVSFILNRRGDCVDVLVRNFGIITLLALNFLSYDLT
jgi:hypothetical protein